MTDLTPVPARVSDGSDSAIQTLSDWREAWMRARDAPSAYWLTQARQRVRWMREPTQGLLGDFHDIAVPLCITSPNQRIHSPQ